MAVSQQENYSTLQNLHYQVYSDKGVQEVFPDVAILQKKIKFASAELEKFGQFFNRAVRLQRPQGGTWTPAGSGAADINPSQAGFIGNAKIQASNILWNEKLGWEDIARAKTSKQAYYSATKLVMTALMEQAKTMYELNLMWGQSGIATVNATPGASSKTFVVTPAEFAPGIFAGQENMPIEFWDSTGVTRRGATFLSTADLSSGSIICTDVLGSAGLGVVGTDVVWRSGTKSAGAAGFNESVGLGKILTNTGTLFGIDGSVATGYALWRPYTKALSGALTFQNVLTIGAAAGNRGLGPKATFIVNPLTFIDCTVNAEALRRLGGSEGKSGTVEIGSEGIKYFGGGKQFEVIPHPMQKAGYAFLVDESSDIWERVGNQDWTFQPPGASSAVVDLPQNMGVEYRLYTNASLFSTAPAHNAAATSITNNAAY